MCIHFNTDDRSVRLAKSALNVGTEVCKVSVVPLNGKENNCSFAKAKYAFNLVSFHGMDNVFCFHYGLLKA